jgi:thiol-disulfide isomerase/thioredoxin
MSAVVLLAFSPCGPADPPVADVAAEVAKVQEAAKARVEKLEAEFATRYKAVETDAERDAFDRSLRAAFLDVRTADREAIRTLMPLLRRSAADPAAVGGLVYAAFEGDDAAREEAGGLLRRHHLKRPEVLTIAESPWGQAADDWVEPLIRDLLADGTAPADRRPRLQFALARHLKEKAELPAKLAGWSERAALYTPERVAQLRKADVSKLEAEALELLDGLVADGVREEFQPGVTLAEAARTAAHEIRNLAVGKTAPEIVGEDLDGRPMRLSDYRGKVVVLSFWHSRCGPCIELARHKRKLVERFAGRPFSPVGANVDEDRDAAKPVVEKHQLTWRSFWCGPKGGSSDIPRAWNVRGWPTVYVIDHTGVIRSKTARGPALDRLLDDLVKRAEADTPK